METASLYPVTAFTPATAFTPGAALLGGALIGLAAVILMAGQGRIAGVSGILSRLLPPYAPGAAGGEMASRALFILGLVAAPAVFGLLAPVFGAESRIAHQVSSNLPLMAFAGLAVGFGAVWGNGCTSGHGICGMARLSRRSFAAVGVFMATAAASVFALRHLAPALGL